MFANGERITDANEFRMTKYMTKKYPLRNSCKILLLGSKMVYKSLNHKKTTLPVSSLGI